MAGPQPPDGIKPGVPSANLPRDSEPAAAPGTEPHPSETGGPESAGTPGASTYALADPPASPDFDAARAALGPARLHANAPPPLASASPPIEQPVFVKDLEAERTFGSFSSDVITGKVALLTHPTQIRPKNNERDENESPDRATVPTTPLPGGGRFSPLLR